jgi:TonB family protein
MKIAGLIMALTVVGCSSTNGGKAGSADALSGAPKNDTAAAPQLVTQMKFGQECSGVKTAYPAAEGKKLMTARVDPRRPPTAPAYPPAALRARVQGTPLITAYINEVGRPIEARVQKSSGSALLDDAAVRSVETWSMIPATIDGQPACMWISFPITFATKN